VPLQYKDAMRLYKIEFKGCKRLAETSCNVDGRPIAFLGPNEAGKSSVLEALDWLSWGEDDLPQRLISRSVDVQSDEWVAKARFSLDEDDLAALSDLDVDGTYREFVASRDRMARRCGEDEYGPKAFRGDVRGRWHAH
jgi:predicted ATP-dependent endonuclease of OLD family